MKDEERNIAAKDAAHLLSRSRQYLLAARSLIEEAKLGDRPLRVPTLHMTAHGIEVFLKVLLRLHGRSMLELTRKPYGHDIWHMWNITELAALRHQAMSTATYAQEAASSWGRVNGPLLNDPKPAFAQHLRDLSELHSNRSNYALRYLADGDRLAPPPHLMLYTFDYLSDGLLKRPDTEILELGLPPWPEFIDALTSKSAHSTPIAK